MSNETVSVVIPAHNSACWLPATIRSVLNQTYSDLEMIVVDDGSTDDTRQIVANFEDQRLHYIYQENQGVSHARNTGIEAARGQYVALLDADDLFKPNKLEQQIAMFRQNPTLGLVTCGIELIDNEGSHLRDECYWLTRPTINLQTLLFWNPLLPSTLLIRREWFDKVGCFDVNLERSEDWEFPVRLALAGCQMDYTREVLISYRRHPQNASTSKKLVPVFTECAVQFMTQLFTRSDLPESIQKIRGRVFGSLYVDAAARAYEAGLGKQGQEWLEMAVTHDPILATGEPPSWVVSLCGHALGTLVDDHESYLSTIAANLPQAPGFQGWTRRRLHAHLHAGRAFRIHNLGTGYRMRLSALWALILDPSLLKNRGLIALAVRFW